MDFLKYKRLLDKKKAREHFKRKRPLDDLIELKINEKIDGPSEGIADYLKQHYFL